MLITCEESAMYFDLNGNFGMPEQAEPSEVSATEKAMPEASLVEETTKPVTPEIKKPTKLSTYRRKPTVSKLQSSVNIKNIIEAPLIQESKVVLNEEHKDVTPIKEIHTRTDIETKEPTIIQVNDVTEAKKTDDSVALDDTSAESDVLSALIDSLTNDSEPSDDAPIVDDKVEKNGELDSTNKIEIKQKIEENMETASHVEQVTQTTPVLKKEVVPNQHISNDQTDEPQSLPHYTLPISPLPALSIDDIVDLVKDSLDKKPESSDNKTTSEEVKPIYQRKEDPVNKDSKIIVITKPIEENKHLIEETTDSKIIPVEIIEPNQESSDSIKAKSRRHLKLSFRKK